MTYWWYMHKISGEGFFNVHFHPSISGKYHECIDIKAQKAIDGTTILDGSLCIITFVIDTLSGGYLSVNPLQLIFDTIETGATKTLSLNIKNTYLSSDTVTVLVRADSLRHFVVEKDSYSLILKPGDTKTYSIDFSPSIIGNFTDTLIIFSNASQTPNPIRIPISGNAIKQAVNSVAFLNYDTKLIIYPNPFHDKSTIKVSSPSDGSCGIKIYDQLGRLVYQSLNNKLHSGDNSFDIKENFVPSAYSIVCNINGKTISAKLMKF
jgi:Secretion system C-terminal sorting domain/Abnormal spindle-like microcephaly-assoc'd, ASPM-SPD-2-Hydin